MALTREQKKIAIDAYYRTNSKGKDLDVFAAVEAVLADQGADLNAKYVQGFEDCRAQAMNVVDEHDGFLQRIEFLKPTVLADQARAAEQGQACTNCGHHNPHTSPAGDVADACNEADCNCGYYTPAQPPAGDVQRLNNQTDYSIKLQHLIESLKREDTPYPELHHHKMILEAKERMTAALAVAREGYVSLAERDAQWEKAIRREMPREFTDLGIDIFVATIRAHVTKPAEQTDERPRYTETLRPCIDPLVCSICGADVLNTQKHSEWHAALKAGKQ